MASCIQHYICLCTLFLPIIACHQVVLTEGRQLKKEDFHFHIKETGNSPGVGHSTKGPKPNISSNYKQLIIDTSNTVEGDDPKHSPGIGHSFHNNKNIGLNV